MNANISPSDPLGKPSYSFSYGGWVAKGTGVSFVVSSSSIFGGATVEAKAVSTPDIANEARQAQPR